MGFLPPCHYPFLPVKSYNVVLGQICHIYVCKPTETRKYEYITDGFQTWSGKLFFHDSCNFIVCEETPVNGFEMETMLGEWIVRQYAALLCKYDYGLKKLQCLGCTIGLKTDHCAQVNIKVMNDYIQTALYPCDHISVSRNSQSVFQPQNICDMWPAFFLYQFEP